MCYERWNVLKDITTIELQGAMYASPVSLCFFNPFENGKTKTVKAALLYGRNGTGKSTIARAFRKIKGEELEAITQATLYDKDTNVVSLTEEEKKSIFVFDEDYVDTNVKLRSDHMDTIVMLGEAADLTKKIEKAEETRQKAEKIYDSHNKKLNEYLDSANVQSPKFYLNKMTDALRGDDNWAGRDRKIKGNRQNSPVREDTYKQFLDLKPVETKSRLLVQFEELLKELQLAKTGASEININIPSIPSLHDNYDTVLKALLNKKIEKPVLNEREQNILKLLNVYGTEEFLDRITYFKKEENTICPYCLQQVSSEYKTDLIQSIEKLLSKEVENHQKSLHALFMNDITIDLTPFEKLSGYQNCTDLLGRINDAIHFNNKQLEIKISNPYEPVNSGLLPICGLYKQLTSALDTLEKERLEYNKKVVDTNPIISILNRINNEITYYDVVGFANQYDKQQSKYTLVYNNNSALLRILGAKKKVVDDLESKRRNVRIALDTINACFKYIFFAEDRLKIDFIDGNYKLFSHGKSVRPCDVSSGERNIIALSYFFTAIMKEQAKKDVYSKEYLLVIDDPVSSFDTENRIGILSFLNYKLGAFLEGNINTKVLIMTHDLMTFYDLHKIVEEIVKPCKTSYTPPASFNEFELCNGTIEKFKYKACQEYTELLERIYNYANDTWVQMYND